MRKKFLVLGLVLGLIVVSGVVLAQESSPTSTSATTTATSSLEEVPIDISGSEIGLPLIHKAIGVRPSLVITPRKIVKMTRAKVVKIDYEEKTGEVEVFGMRFKIDAKEAYVVKRPIYRMLRKRMREVEGIEGIPFENSKIKVGDYVNVIGRLVEEGYPALVKAKIIKDLNRVQPRVKALKRLLKRVQVLPKKLKKKIGKRIIGRKIIKRGVGKKIKRKVNILELRRKLQELLKKVKNLQGRLYR